MAEIIIEGNKIDTKDIWDIELKTGSRWTGVIIKVTDKPNIEIGRSIPYETYPSQFRGYYDPYEKLFEQIKTKWEADKSDIPIFKLI